MINKVIIVFLILIMPVISVQAQDIQATQITNDLLIIHGGGGNITAIRTDSGIVVIDSFVSPQAAEEARNFIAKYFPELPIKYLINTHHHSDHVQGNQYFRDALIIGHKNLKKHMMDDYEQLVGKYGNYNDKIMELKDRLEKLKDETGLEANNLKKELVFWKEAKVFMEELVPTPPCCLISSDTTLSFGGKTLEILYYGTAHTDNDLVILIPEDQLLIMGDLLFYRKCYIMNYASDIKNWITILNKMIKRSDEYKYVIPGHGAVVVNVEALVAQCDYLNILLNTVTDAYHRGLTLDQAKKEIKLENYKEYIDYDRIGLDIEACWHQLWR